VGWGERGIRDSGRATGKVDLLRTGLTSHCDDFSTRCSSDNTIINEKDVSVLELGLHSVQLTANTLLAGLLFRHNEGAEDITVLDKTLAVGLVEVPGHGSSRCCRRLGDGNDDVNVFNDFRTKSGHDFCGKAITHPLATAVDANAVNYGIRTSEVHVFEDIGSICLAGSHLTEDRLTTLLDQDGLTRFDITHVGETELMQSNRFGGHHVVGTRTVNRGSGAEHQGADTIRVAEAQDTEA